MSEVKPKYRNWRCSNGHSYESALPILAVRCGKCPKPVWMKPEVDSRA